MHTAAVGTNLHTCKKIFEKINFILSINPQVVTDIQ